MRGWAGFAVFLCFGAGALCQSATTAPGSAKVAPGDSSTPQAQFSFDTNLFGQMARAEGSGDVAACDGGGAKQERANAETDAKTIFHAPCMRLGTQREVAQMDLWALPKLGGVRMDGKAEAIPTQWPGGKAEPIPTTWANLKLLPIDAGKPSAAPAK